ncbi:uncharacterized protein N7503_000218 [Penicillium pulvis]|uniref:uncharacterized protein n=1 Tax=Penicillium pulvis TaxID=1562058 RepID=UPI002546BC92|nr:uncharacterized protein N7503_000218 [Penicillium pulvis]KAJ5813468.1 hypothetical protein N7503_000218 [Penicillium pulvis]
MPPEEIPGMSFDYHQSSVPNFQMKIPLLLFNDADTLLYIDPPPEDGPKCLPTIPLRVHSEKLLTTGSAYFAKQFTPRFQKRVRRQRGFVDKLPNGIKYLVDLTPATLEEDAIIALTEVSCPMAIRKWASLESKWSLPSSCVGGEDEYQMWERPDPTTIFEPVTINGNLEEAEDEYASQEEPGTDSQMPSQGNRNTERPTPSTIVRKGLPVEYSAARHRDGIEHVLHVLEGLSISLDTPCKLWTFFAVAKLFDVATLPSISEYITSWFYNTTIARFIEIHPAIAYRVACGIKSSSLCRYAFRGLVSDEALLYLIRTAQIKPLERWTSSFTNSRLNEDLDDNEIQRIEYASKAFVDTVVKDFIHMAGEEMSWIEGISECAKLNEHARAFPEDKELVQAIIEILKKCARLAIYRRLVFAADPLRSCDAVPKSARHLSDRLEQIRTMVLRARDRAFNSQDCLVRLMGRSFWTELGDKRLALTMDYSEAMIFLDRECKHDSIAEIGCGLLAFQGQENAKIRYIERQTLEERIRDFNELVERRDKERDDILKIQKQERTESVNQQWNLTINLRRRTLQGDQPVPSSSDDASSTAIDVNPLEKTTLPERPAERAEHYNSQQPSQRDIFSLYIPYPDPDESTPVHEQGSASTPTVPHYESNNATSAPSNPTGAEPEGMNVKNFDLDKFTLLATEYLSKYCRARLDPTDQTLFQYQIGDILTCLTRNEYQYLPLWADGNDDGTGGVFTDQDIPIMASGGFSAPGPQVHTGGVASTDDSFSDINPSDSQSTVQGASHHATNSHASDLMSVDSYDEIEHPGSVVSLESRNLETIRVNRDYGYSVSSVKSDDEECDVYSAGASTVVMGSPKLSGFSDDEMDIMGNDEDDFDMVDDLN